MLFIQNKAPQSCPQIPASCSKTKIVLYHIDAKRVIVKKLSLSTMWKNDVHSLKLLLKNIKKYAQTKLKPIHIYYKVNSTT